MPAATPKRTKAHASAAAKAKPAKAPAAKAPAKTPAKAPAVKAPAKTPAKSPKAAAPASGRAAAPARAERPAAAQVSAPAHKSSRPPRMPKIDPEQRQHYVEVAAYYIAERRGFLGGCEVEDWVQAEREIDDLLREGRLSA
jgi:hypothetical protein